MGATAGLSSSAFLGDSAPHCWTSQQWHPFFNSLPNVAHSPSLDSPIVSSRHAPVNPWASTHGLRAPRIPGILTRGSIL